MKYKCYDLYRNMYTLLAIPQKENAYRCSSIISYKGERKEGFMKQKRILILTWEYPPMLVGGLGRHVYELSKAVAEAGHIIHVITNSVEGSLSYEHMDNVHIHRVKSHYEDQSNFYKWIAGLNDAMIQYADCLCKEMSFDLVHAHDWLVCTAAKTLKYAQALPLITTIHATEHGRNYGIHTSLQREIHMKEKELVQEADAIIVCSQYMKREVQLILESPPQKLFVFPNGIDENFFRHAKPSYSVRQKYKLQDRTLIFSIGRIVNEKGFYTVIEAAPSLIEKYPHIIFIVAGKGPMLDMYRHIITERGLQQFISFVGHISEEEQRAFLQESDIVLVPSLYEPFGIVALEGMLAKKPTIVSDVGGLREIIEHGENGYKIEPGNACSLNEQIEHVLANTESAHRVAQNGFNLVRKEYSWKRIAADTLGVYQIIAGKCKNGR
jgi:glycosyltransferase involved in cell wall biosynthesis